MCDAFRAEKWIKKVSGVKARHSRCGCCICRWNWRWMVGKKEKSLSYIYSSQYSSPFSLFTILLLVVLFPGLAFTHTLSIVYSSTDILTFLPPALLLLELISSLTVSLYLLSSLVCNCKPTHPLVLKVQQYLEKRKMLHKPLMIHSVICSSLKSFTTKDKNSAFEKSRTVTRWMSLGK